MDNRHQLKEPHPYSKWRDDKYRRGAIKASHTYGEHEHSRHSFHLKTTAQLISHMVHIVVHKGNVLQSQAIGNNSSEESDVTTDCPLCNNVSFNRPVSSWHWDNCFTVPVPPDRLWPPTAASVHSQGHMGGMRPSKAHVEQLNEGIMRHGGRTIHA